MNAFKEYAEMDVKKQLFSAVNTNLQSDGLKDNSFQSHLNKFLNYFLHLFS